MTRIGSFANSHAKDRQENPDLIAGTVFIRLGFYESIKATTIIISSADFELRQ